MWVKERDGCRKFESGDGCALVEFIHPAKDGLKVNYSLAQACLRPFAASKPHVLKASETYYIISGRGFMHIDGEEREVFEGCVVHIEPNSLQYIKNTESAELRFLCIVEPAWRPENEKIL
jgi:mannose-6-phosphate isomerase-like protein (cupin superfamily)